MTNINILLRANPVNSARGAPMGSTGYINDDQPLTGLLCQKMIMVDGDYSADGVYWGYSPKHGQMYAVFNSDNSEYRAACGLLKFYRAHSRSDAIAQFLEDNPDYKFARGAK